MAQLLYPGGEARGEHQQPDERQGQRRHEPRGQQRFYHLEPVPLAEVDAWLHPFECYWRKRMRAIDAALNEQQKEPDR